MTAQSSTPALGVIFLPAFPPESLAGYARKAEAAGFDELWLWDDCFQPGALTSAAIALAATERLKVGIGLLPATVMNPIFAAMEITTLARNFPGRILPCFGHGVGFWMAQIGAAPKSTMTALSETVTAVRRLLQGERFSMQGQQLRLEAVQLSVTPDEVPPLYIGAMREKTMQLAGRLGDGTLLTGLASPEYVRWAVQHIRAGMEQASEAGTAQASEAGTAQAGNAGTSQAGRKNRVVVYQIAKVNPDGEAARAAARRNLADWLPWSVAMIEPLGIANEMQALYQAYGNGEAAAEHIPDAWLDAMAAAGTPEQVAAAVRRMAAAGADAIILQPVNDDPQCLEEYAKYLLPIIR